MIIILIYVLLYYIYHHFWMNYLNLFEIKDFNTKVKNDWITKWNTYSREYLTPNRYLDTVCQNGFELQYIIDQTPEIWFTVVQKNGLALQYIIDESQKYACILFKKWISIMICCC